MDIRRATFLRYSTNEAEMSGTSLRRQLRDLDRTGLAKFVAIVCIHEGYRTRFRTTGGNLTVLARRPGRSVERVYWIDADAAATVRRVRAFDTFRRRGHIAHAAVVTASEYDDDVRDVASDLGLKRLAAAELAELASSNGLEFYVSDLVSEETTVDLNAIRKRFEEPLVKDRRKGDAVYFRNGDW